MAATRKTILLVEDDAILAMIERQQLENEGYRVIHALSGEKAVDLVCTKKDTVDLILMDIDLGKGMDGTEAAREILGSDEIPILFLSSHTEKEIVEKTESITNYGYVVKNSSFTVLDASIKMAFKLFEANKRLQDQKMDIEAAYKETQATNENLMNTKNQLMETEKSLRKSERKWQTLVELIPDYISIYDKDGKFLFLNHYIQGYTEEDVIGSDATQYLAPESKRLFKDYIKKCFSSQTIQKFEHSAMGDKGSKLTFEDFAIPIPEDGNMPGALLLVSRDITERKKVEEAYRRTSNEWLSLVKAIPDFISIHDLEGRFVFMNQYAEGFSENDVLGTSAYQYLSPESKEIFMKNSEACKQSQGIQVFEHTGMGDHAEMREYSNFLIPIIEEGNVKNILVVSRDITDQKRNEDRVKSLLAEKELILREVHHRMKNNMDTVCALLQMKLDYQTNPETRYILTSAVSQIKSMSVLYSKLYESDTINSLSFKLFLHPLVKEIINLFPHGDMVQYELEVEDFHLSGKLLSPLGIIINELITNSMKYAFSGKTGILKVKASRKGSVVLVEYQDNGAGLPDSVSFDSSTGFGMMLVKMLVDQIDGSIRIERGNGTKFYIEFEA